MSRIVFMSDLHSRYVQSNVSVVFSNRGFRARSFTNCYKSHAASESGFCIGRSIMGVRCWRACRCICAVALALALISSIWLARRLNRMPPFKANRAIWTCGWRRIHKGPAEE
jgi:hypothetical protein